MEGYSGKRVNKFVLFSYRDLSNL